MEDKLLENLENVGMNGLMLVFLFGLYKFLISRNLVSKCGIFNLDLRSAETRQLELEYKHKERLAELEVQKLQATIVNDKYYVTNDKENDNHFDENKSSTK